MGPKDLGNVLYPFCPQWGPIATHGSSPKEHLCGSCIDGWNFYFILSLNHHVCVRVAALLDRSALDTHGKKGKQHTWKPPGCLAPATHYHVHPFHRGRGLRPYSADKAAEPREAKYFLRGHTAGRDGVGLDPSLSDFGVSLFPVSLPGGHRGGQLGN